MIRTVRILLILTTIVTMAYVLPFLFWKAFDKKVDHPNVAYSSISKDFLFREYNGRENVYFDNNGVPLSRKEYQGLLPMIYFRQLAIDHELPDSLFGVEMDLHRLSLNSMHFKLKPSEILSPDYGLYPLFESESGSVSLEMPYDYFRIGNRGMQFIDAESNRLDEEKSLLFTEALQEQGFVFPARKIAGIPTTIKSKDEGYFVVDDADHLFHIKMKQSKPAVVIVPIMRDLIIKHIACVDLKTREFYCYVLSEHNELYVILTDSYDFKKLPIRNYSPETDELRIMSNLFNKQIIINGRNSINVFVVDRDYNLIDHYLETWTPKKEDSSVGVVASVFFPFTLQIKHKNSEYIYPKLKMSTTLWVLVLNLCLALVFASTAKFSRSRINAFDFGIVAIFGIYGLIGVMAFPQK